MEKKKFIPLGMRDRDEQITIEELAEHLKRSEEAIYTDRHRNPGKIPPACTPPKAVPIRWRVGTVLDFAQQQEEKNWQIQQDLQARIAAARKPAAKRGRPTKAEYVKRRAAAANGVG